MPQEDQGWRRLEEMAAQLRGWNKDRDVDVDAERRRKGVWTVEGLAITNPWTDVVEPVRRRAIWSGVWHEVQSLQEAGDVLRQFLVDRPDLRGLEGGRE